MATRKDQNLEDCIDFIFNIYDCDNSGKLKKPQALRLFRELFNYFNSFMSDPEFEDLFDRVDLDDDGFLSKDELRRIIHNSQYY